MMKPPNKEGTDKPSIPMIKLPPGNQYQTRVATQATNATRPAPASGGNTSTQPKEVQEGKGKAAEINSEKAPGTNKQKPTTLQTITQAIHIILKQAKPERKVKSLLEDLVRFISEAEEKEKERMESNRMQTEVSTLHEAIKQDLSRMHESLAKQIDGVLDTVSVTLENSEKTLTTHRTLKSWPKKSPAR
jgi:hypothetical protein